jgi:hypothetical protein
LRNILIATQELSCNRAPFQEPNSLIYMLEIQVELQNPGAFRVMEMTVEARSVMHLELPAAAELVSLDLKALSCMCHPLATCLLDTIPASDRSRVCPCYVLMPAAACYDAMPCYAMQSRNGATEPCITRFAI